MKTIAVILSGCGFLDGSEIHEAVLGLFAIAQAGRKYQCFAPDHLQKEVVDHATQKKMQEKRNILHEAARIARGDILPLSQLKEEEFEGLFLPGGWGVALNLSNFAEKREKCDVNKDLARVVLAFYEKKKPIAATCLAPVVLAKILGPTTPPIQMTLGKNPSFIKTLETIGIKALPAAISEVVSDRAHHIYTTPCYMEEGSIADMGLAIQKLIKLMLQS